VLVVSAIVTYPMLALATHTTANVAEILAPITGIAGAIVGYWFGQASRRIETGPGNGDNGQGSNKT